MKILSLFDGMACGMLAMQSAGVRVDRYVAFEIDKYAVQTSTHNFPMIEHRGDVFQADFTEFSGFDFLVGGSPCTYWSIAQKNNRETEASGMGWELFSQYVRALHEAKPMYFIYENNKSMSNAIRESITEAFGFEPVCINSALVSAQNRQRLYWVGRRNPDGTYSRVKVEQPEDRGILLREVLDGLALKEKANCLCGNRGGCSLGHDLEKQKHNYVAVPVSYGRELTEREMDYMVREIKGGRNHFDFGYIQDGTKDKGACPTANVSKGVPYNVCCIPVRIPEYGDEDKARPLGANYSNNCGGFEHRMFSNNPNKQQVDMVAQPVRIGTYQRDDGAMIDHQQTRIYSTEGKSVTLCGNGGGMGAKTGLYAIPTEAVGCEDGKTYTVYQVRDGQITIKGKQYPIKLSDGYYIIRKLTVSECKRLQTVPEWYEFPVSDTQAYKMLGNGWTVEVIAHLIKATQSKELEEEQLDLFRLEAM
jgi:DNA (cytosine-5)-methyltransferase 3A